MLKRLDKEVYFIVYAQDTRRVLILRRIHSSLCEKKT